MGRGLLLSSVIAVWGLSVGGGTAQLWNYSMQPGRSPDTPATWPSNADIPHDPHAFTLLIAVHPQCPCTRASLGELAKIMRHATQPVRAIALMNRPTGTAEGFEHSELWDQADSIPGVQAHVDADGTLSRAFGLSVSGAAVVYDSEQRLRFAGGITAARGHMGDNAGSDAVISMLSGNESRVTRTPVYGCDLFAPRDCRCETTINGEVAPCCQ